MKTYLAFGDSNTHGSEPMATPQTYLRFPPGVRWPTVAHAALGDGWHLVEEGLPGRTTQFADQLMGDHMDGQEGLKIAMMSHAPVDLISIMLGTNDCKTRLGATPEQMAAGIAGLLDILRDPGIIARAGRPRVLIIAPPPLDPKGEWEPEWIGAAEKSRALPPLLREVAEAYGHGFLDAGQVISVAPGEGIHFDADAHRALGQAAGDALKALI